jgi:putative ABC transport system permease protein
MPREAPTSPRRGLLIRRALGTRRARGLLAAGGIGTNVVLVLVLFAAYRSVEDGVREYCGAPEVDLWVAPRGTGNLVRSAGLIPEVVVEDIAAMPAVREASPVVRTFVDASPEPASGRPALRALTLLALGYRLPSGLGGPARVVAGHPPRGAGDVLLDRAAAYRLGVSVGGKVDLNGRTMTVVGLTSRTNLISIQLVFLDVASAGTLAGLGGSASFVAVGLRPGARRDDVARQIEEAFPGLSVHTREAFVERNEEDIFSGFRPVRLLVSAVGLVAAAVLVALLALATVADRRRDIAILLALGAGVRTVAGGIAFHMVKVVLAGAAAGTAAAYGLGAVLDRWVPTLEATPRPGEVAGVLVTFIAVGLVGSLGPLLRLGRTDPVEAFRP